MSAEFAVPLYIIWTVLMCFYLGWEVARGGWRSPWIILAVQGLLYPFGRLLQIDPLAPEFILSYMADVGFIPTGVIMFGIAFAPSQFAQLRTIITRRLAVLITLVVAVAFESMQLVANITTNKLGGDWVDLAIFLLMGAWTWILVGACERYKLPPASIGTS